MIQGVVDTSPGFLVVIVALGWLAHALWMERRVSRLWRETSELAQAVDTVLRGTPKWSGRTYVSHDEFSQVLSREIESLTGQMAARGNIASGLAGPGETAANVVAHPSARRVPEPATRERKVAERLAAAIASDSMQVSLQPIVSVSQGETVAFEVFADVDLEGGGRQVVRRVRSVGPLDGADFEQAMLLAVVDTARRRLGTISERMKLHVAVSEVFLSHEQAVSDICEILRIHPGIARSVVLSLPGDIAERAELFAPVRALFDAGLMLVLECDGRLPGTGHGMPPVTVFKFPAEDLLAMARACGSAELPRLPQALAEASIIACDVASEDEAMVLIDLGIDLMRGDIFSPPRRLGPDFEPREGPRVPS